MFRKILLIAGSLLLLLLAAAFILPIVYKDKIVALVKEEVNRKVNAKVDFGDFDLTLIRSFPDFSLSLSQIRVTGLEPFNGDTLISANELLVTLDVMSVIKGGPFDIKTIRLSQPRMRLLVLKDGRANWDIAKADSSAATASGEPGTFKVALRSYSIENGYIMYDDASMGFRMELDKLQHEGKGDFTQDLFEFRTMTNAERTELWYGGIKYLHHIRTRLKADLDMDMPNMKFTFKDNELVLNELALGFSGWLAMPGENIDMDLLFDAKQNEFRHFLSLVPGVYSEQFKGLKSSGSLGFKGFVKGTYNEKRMPGFGVKLKISNGQFQYPSLPVGVNNVQVALDINNPDGVPDHTLIDLQRLHLELGREPFDASLRVRTPVSDPDLNGMIKGKINMANLSKIVPMETGTSIRGQMNADLKFAGRMSAIEKEQYENFDASGNMQLSDFAYNSKDYKQGFDLRDCQLTFNPKNISLNNLEARMGKSDFKANGSLDNMLAYLFRKEVLKGSLNLISTTIDLADFESGSAAATSAAADTTPMSLIEIPGNIDFSTHANISRLVYDNVVLENLDGSLLIRDQSLKMDNLSFTTLGGALKMSGIYATPERKKANIAFNFDMNGVDIQQAVKTFNTVKKMATIAERTSGRVSTQFTMNGQLDEYMQPLLNTLTGGGLLSTASVSIKGSPAMLKVADALKLDQFRQLDVNNVKLSFKFENGRVNVAPFPVILAGIPTTVSGSTGFDQTLDYTFAMSIPSSKLPPAATGAITGLIKQANKKGANFSMSETIKVNAKIGGTVNNPNVSTDIKETTGKALNQLTDKAKEELEKKRKEAEERARAEAEKLKSEAEARAKAEADKLKKEAESKAKAEAEKLKKEAEKKAKEGLKNIFGPKK